MSPKSTSYIKKLDLILGALEAVEEKSSSASELLLLVYYDARHFRNLFKHSNECVY